MNKTKLTPLQDLESKLKPCPFCGSADVCANYHGYGVRCKACLVSTLMGNRQEAEETWNRRIAPPILHCESCGCERVRLYRLDHAPVIECEDCARTWSRDA